MIQTALIVLAWITAFVIVFLVGRHVLSKLALAEPWPTIVGLGFLLLCLVILAGGFGAFPAPWRWRG